MNSFLNLRIQVAVENSAELAALAKRLNDFSTSAAMAQRQLTSGMSVAAMSTRALTAGPSRSIEQFGAQQQKLQALHDRLADIRAMMAKLDNADASRADRLERIHEEMVDARFRVLNRIYLAEKAAKEAREKQLAENARLEEENLKKVKNLRDKFEAKMINPAQYRAGLEEARAAAKDSERVQIEAGKKLAKLDAADARVKASAERDRQRLVRAGIDVTTQLSKEEADAIIEQERAKLREIEGLMKQFKARLGDYIGTKEFDDVRGRLQEIRDANDVGSPVRTAAADAIGTLEKQRAAQINTARVEAERITLERIRRMREEYALDEISAEGLRAGLAEVADKSPVNSKARREAAKRLNELDLKLEQEKSDRKLEVERAYLDAVKALREQYDLGRLDANRYRTALAGIRDANERDSAAEISATRAMNKLDVELTKQAADEKLKIQRGYLTGVGKLLRQYRAGKIDEGRLRTSLTAIRDKNPENSTASVRAAEALAALERKVRTEAERRTLDEIAMLKKKYAAKAINEGQIRAKLEQIRDSSPVDTKPWAEAALELVRIEKKIADQIKSDRIAAERATLDEIAQLRKQHQARMIGDDEYKSRLASIRDANPADSKAGTAAALALEKQREAYLRLHPVKKAFMTRLEEGPQKLQRYGKDVQWTGRQLEYNFTLPILRATRAIFEYQIANEKALTSLVKVYGDGSDASGRLSTKTIILGQNLQAVNRGAMSEIEQTAYDLGRAFRALSDGFGVSIDKVSQIGSLWAAAGQQGIGLARSVKNTMEAMLIGDFTSSEEAFKALIKVQTAYQLSASQVRQAMALINVADNTTAARFTDLVQAIGRGGATMHTAGVSLREFTAMLTLLIPSNTAESAGNGMKTLMSRIMAPTDDAKEAIEELGITMDETFYSMTGTERLTALAKAYDAADASTQQFTAAAVAGRYQINRFDLLMNGLLDTTSDYHKVLNATADGLGENSNALQTYEKELQLFLESTPQSVEIAKTMIMNLASQILVKLVPNILKGLEAAKQFINFISTIDEKYQGWIRFGLVALALIGPLMRLYGAFAILASIGGTGIQIFGKLAAKIAGIETLQKGVVPAIKAISSAMRVMAASAWASIGPWGLLVIALIAVAAAVYIFRDDIIKALQPVLEWASKQFNAFVEVILRAFNALPAGIQNALIAVVRTISIAVKKAWEWLQWLNPFKRHSPSLVDNVTAGVKIIAAQYASLANIGRVYMSAANGLRNFTAATADLRQKVLMNERADVQKNIGENMPEVLPAVNVMFAHMDKLKAAMDAVTVEVEKQQQVVNALDAEYRRLGLRLKEAESAFKLVERAANTIKDQLDAAKDRLSNWASTPIEGSKALSDALFENEMAQKRLRLEIMRMEDAGQSVEDVANKLALLQGEIETLQALQSELRSAGAGSEITGQLDAQIKALRDQAAALQGGANNSGIALLEEQLKRLQREAERMDLEGAIRFDPLKRQIEDLANTTKEATFEEIIAGMRQARAEVDVLTVQYEEAKKAVDAQKPGLDILRTAHSDLGDTLDIEQEKLSLLKDSYSELEELYNRIDEAIRALVSDLETLGGAAADAGSGFPAGDFTTEDFAGIADTGDLKSFADDLLAQFEESFGKLDFLAPFREKWEMLKNGVRSLITGENIAKLIISALLPGPGWAVWFIDFEKAWDGIKTAWSLVWGTLKERFSIFMGIIRTIGDTIWGVIKRIGDVFGSIGSTIGSVVGAVIGFFANFGDNMGSIFGNIGDILSRAGSFIETLFTEKIPYAIGWLVGSFVAMPFKLLEALGDLGGFLWNGISRGFGWLRDNIDDILRAIAMFFIKLPGRAIEALNDFGGLIWRGIKGGFNWLVDQVGGIIDSIVDFFKKLPGRISDLVGGVADAAKGIGSAIWNAIKDGFGGAWDIAGDLIRNMGSVMTRVYNGLIDKLETALNSAIRGFNDAAPSWLPNVPELNLSFLYARGVLEFHKGGIVPGMVGTEVPAVLQAGEGVLSLRMMDLIERATKTTPAPEQGVVNNNNSKTVNFYGDLSFPNITDPNDAERFIRNLEALAVA